MYFFQPDNLNDKLPDPTDPAADNRNKPPCLSSLGVADNPKCCLKTIIPWVSRPKMIGECRMFVNAYL